MKIQDETKDYWRWKMIRCTSDFINNPNEENTKLLEDLMKNYISYQNVQENCDDTAMFEPHPAEFVCSIGLY